MVVSSRDWRACERVATAIRASGGEAIVIPCNVSRKPEVEALIEGSLRHYGAIDILVCNAAVNPVFGPLAQLSDEAFDKVMGANVKANIWLCNRVIPGMAERGDGAVVIVSSIGGLRGTEVLEPTDHQGGRFCTGPQPRGGVGPAQCPRQLHRAGFGENRFARALWEDEARLAARTAQTPLRRIGMPDKSDRLPPFWRRRPQVSLPDKLSSPTAA